MYYWNKQNFEGLLQLADALDADPRLSLLGEYCRQREYGLRQKALEALERFLTTSEAWEPSHAREVCQQILVLHALTPEAHQFLSQPLLTRFIFPVLEAWEADEPECQVAVRWLGMLQNDAERLSRALVLFPGDVPVRRRLVDWYLSTVEHATHHLGEGRLLNDLEQTKQSLVKARTVVDASPNPAMLADLRAEICEYEAMLQDWELYSASPDGSFPDWCARRSRPYSWPTFFYYKE